MTSVCVCILPCVYPSILELVSPTTPAVLLVSGNFAGFLALYEDMCMWIFGLIIFEVVLA